MSQTKQTSTFEKFLLVVVIVSLASIYIPMPFVPIVFGNWTILQLVCVAILAPAAPYECYKFFKRRIEQRRQAKEAKNHQVEP
jgi:hypothetical protein